MYILSLLLIPLILVSLYFELKFSYIISLLCSLAAATFIYRQAGLNNILLTIAVFNLAPLVCRHLNLQVQKSRSSLQAKRLTLKAEYTVKLKEQSLITQSNAQLANEVSRIAELYKITRDMSSVLGVKEICDIFCKKLVEHFRFSKCRIILIDEAPQGLAIKQVFAFEYGETYVRQVDAQTEDNQVLKLSLRAEKITYLEDRPTVLIPLTSENKFLGTLVVDDLPYQALENFSILAEQFSLEFKRVRLYQKVEELAITDGLTSLFVRRYFLQRLQEEIDRSARHKLNAGFLMLDLDHFKQCNDHFGHLTGDTVLREAGRKIKACVREIDLVARYGGEEFSVLLPDTDKEGAYQAAERIRLRIAEHPFKAYGQSLDIHISAGVALYPLDSTSVQELIDKADQALYRAKQGGRNRVCLFAK